MEGDLPSITAGLYPGEARAHIEHFSLAFTGELQYRSLGVRLVNDEELLHLHRVLLHLNLSADREGAGGEIPLSPILLATESSKPSLTLGSEPVLQTLHLQPGPLDEGVGGGGGQVIGLLHPAPPGAPVLACCGVGTEDRVETSGVTELASLADLRTGGEAGEVTETAQVGRHHCGVRQTGRGSLHTLISQAHPALQADVLRATAAAFSRGNGGGSRTVGGPGLTAVLCTGK